MGGFFYAHWWRQCQKIGRPQNANRQNIRLTQGKAHKVYAKLRLPHRNFGFSMPQRRKISLCGDAAFAPAETPRGGTAWKTKTPARQQLDSCAQSLACAPPGLKTHLGAASPYRDL
jgi:hypothetical protein